MPHDHLVAPPSVPDSELVVSDWMGPGVGSALHAVLLTADQHQVLPEHLLTWQLVHSLDKSSMVIDALSQSVRCGHPGCARKIAMRCIKTTASRKILDVGVSGDEAQRGRLGLAFEEPRSALHQTRNCNTTG